MGIKKIPIIKVDGTKTTYGEIELGQIPRKKEKPKKQKKVKDLSYGEDLRGDYAYFIEEKHFIDTWKVDKKAGTGTNDPMFFRVIKNGKQTSSHGWIEDNKVVQWG